MAIPETPETRSWRTDMQALALECAASEPAEAADRLREARRLVCAAPVLLRVLWSDLPAEEQFEAMLAVGALESAALTLIAPSMGYMLSRGPGGTAMASLIMPGASEDLTACGATPALALVGALAGALAGDGREIATRPATSPRPGDRLN